MRIEGCNDEVDEMQCKSKVRNKLATRYKEEDGNNSDRGIRYVRE